MVKGLLQHNLFQLLPCYEKDCPHPVCSSGKPDKELTWYEGGPPLSYLPIPIPDERKPWGRAWVVCNGSCTGHYVTPEEHLELYNKYGDKDFMKTPPKDVLESAFKSKGKDVDIEEYARSCLITTDEASWFLQHLNDVSNRRKAGARRGAEKRQKKQKTVQGTLFKNRLLNICDCK